MASPAEIARLHTALDPSSLAHLQKLMGSWSVLADLSFSDLLLYVPEARSDSRYVVLGQMRPTTSQTLHRDDLVGSVIDVVERPLVDRAFRLGEIVEGEVSAEHHERARSQCIPVRRDGHVLAVLCREAALTVGRRPGELERIYVETFDRFARMILSGAFPFEGDDSDDSESPRVGDGVTLLDSGGRIEYSSPNAVNALHRMGINTNSEGMRLEELGIEQRAVATAFATGLPVTEEVERRPDVSVLLRCVPLVDGDKVTGAIVLMRDVTDLRRRDRLLMSKDATIREVHHRVKNNLQTISSLLRLQARRLPLGSGRIALQEAERRIRSIGFVHEILSRDAGEQVAFNEIVRQLVRMAEDGVVNLDRPVRYTLAGDAGELDADVATPLAVVLTELLQNAAEHGFAAEPGPTLALDAGTVRVTLANDGTNLSIEVRDNGSGLPEDFSIETTDSLGLSIVRDLVTTQLGGTISMRNDEGTVVDLLIPVKGQS
jgi:two-component system, sensor histidine kinase PdtaS